MVLKRDQDDVNLITHFLHEQSKLTADRINETVSPVQSIENMEDIISQSLGADEWAEYQSRLLGIPRISLHILNPEREAFSLIPEDMARKYQALPFALKDGKLCVAMSDPTHRIALDDLSLYTGLSVEPYMAEAEQIKAGIRECYTISRSTSGYTTEPIRPVNAWKMQKDDAGQEAPVINIVDSFLMEAIAEKASDIHWEPTAQGLIIRFRVDGVLSVKATLPIEIARSIAARLKVMAGMDVTERRRPQDGRIMLELPYTTIDIRVSTFSTVYGEKVMTRILDMETAQRTLSQLGLREEVEAEVRSLLKRPYGLILATGPTGSGKTTTLYALLRELASDRLNIISIEDPVEYRIPGVNQSQVNVKAGLDFAGGLRAILRQDPDIIMVGEIRDRETAQIATAAALTGHLVLSTLHTNSASEALARLLDMGIEPYLVASAVCGIIAQRLVRRLCPHCARSRPLRAHEKMALQWNYGGLVAEAIGCSKCRGTGYSGRIGIHEFIPYNTVIKELILKKSGAAAIEQACRALSIPTLKEDGLHKAARGLTSLDEVIRLTVVV